MNNNEAILADTPLEDPKDDRLGFATFAKNLAEAVCEVTSDECLVFSLFGPWGSGKTSCLNFVRYYVNRKPEEQSPIIIQFNPWWFSGHGELLYQFFREFSAALGKKKRLKEISSLLADFVAVLSEVPEPTGVAKIAGKIVHKVLRRQLKEASKIRLDIKTYLQKLDSHILVIIDDIDRLTFEEIRSVFRVIKAVADFPKTVYLLAFDKEIVAKSLEIQHEISGEDYLKKIVQVPFELPIPDKTALRKLFSEQLNFIFSEIPQDQFDETYWKNVFLDGIDHFLNTMRDVKVLINAIKMTYPPVKGEVNPVDFAAIETIRVFSSNIYHLIRSNPEKFAGHSDRNSYPRIEDIKPFHNKYIELLQEEEREVYKKFLKRIFPKLEAVFDDMLYGSDWEITWRKQLRICSPDIFPIYFQLATPAGDISQAEMKTTLASAENSVAVGNELVELTKKHRPDGSTKLSVFLEKMEDYTEKDISIEHIPNILNAFFAVGDKLLVPEDEGKGIFSWGNNIRIGRIMHQLLRRYETEEERFNVLKEAISKGQAISVIVSKVTTLGQQHGKYGAKERPEEEYIVIQDHLMELEKIALSKIKNAAKNNKLLRSPEMAHVLYRWRDWEGESPLKKWVSERVASDRGFVDFLVGFLSKSYSMGMTDRVGKEHWRLYPNTLEPFLDLKKVYDRCKGILKFPPEWLIDKKKIAVNTFIKGYEIRLKGKNPSVPLEWEEIDNEE